MPTLKTPTTAVKLAPAHQHALCNFDNLPDSAEVSDAVVAVLLSVTRQTVWKWAGNQLPNPIKRGRTARWKVGALRQVINAGG
jgi:hypothetical protein